MTVTRAGSEHHADSADGAGADQPRAATAVGVPGTGRVDALSRGARQAMRAVAKAAARTAHLVSEAWRRSLQLRVGATTAVVATVIVLVIGLFLIDKVSAGILNAKRDAAVTQARIGLHPARNALDSVTNSLDSLSGAENEISDSVSSGPAGAGIFTVEIGASGQRGVASSTVRDVPRALQRSVQRGNLAMQYAPITDVGDGGGTVPGLIVGEPVAASGSQFELYYLFPLTAEEQTIALVQRTVLLAGLALVILVLGIALLVTRQVVRPVRVAAETAGRLAGGDLAQRIPVHGTDDIARLGESFNDMAGSLQRQIRRLEDLSRLQQRFTSDVSHELRTPLTTIRMATEYLHSGRDELPADFSRAVELLATELDRFEGLLGDLLEISRHDAGAARLESVRTDIREVVAGTVESSLVLAQRHGSEIVVDVPDEPVNVDMDARRVERILRNIVANALDHGEGKPVEIRVGYDADAVAVTVRDHGIGLRPGEAGLVFNRFWRGDPSRSRLTGGTGLGLAISLEDARLHDGWLQAWGERGRGAQFRLTLPRQGGHTLMHSPLPLDPDETEEEDE
ncbi:MtrAB system histidine kinase MtrB [uncultured Jatrophihabitans sp.]|uniref:MtrAB system histidine kinase MtrB n=1 Tax=uncultured Jatrophihabitans sp. TaxID=1610747 RepID=UPI0035CB703B